MTDNTDAQAGPNTFSYADFISRQKEHKQMVTAFLSNKKKEILTKVYNEINKECNLPETIHVRSYTPFSGLLRSSDTPEVYAFCSEVAALLQQNGFKYKADSTHSRYDSPGAFICAFKKKDTVRLF